MAGYRVIIETGKKKVFASAADWPGWARGGVSEEAAIETLLAYAPRYEAAISSAGAAFLPPKTARGIDVVAHVEGGSSTDYGMPGTVADTDSEAVSDRELDRLVSLLDACWQAFDSAVKGAGSQDLAKGPRGGGRQVDAIIPHVVDSFGGYLKKLGAPSEALTGELGRKELMALTAEALGMSARGELPAKGPRGGKRWPARYFVRRAAWHILDHAWEIEDRSKHD